MSFFYVVCAILAAQCTSGHSSKIIIVPYPSKSHLLYMSEIGFELQKRGHEVIIPYPRQLTENVTNHLIQLYNIPPNKGSTVRYRYFFFEIKHVAEYNLMICRSLLTSSLVKELKDVDLVFSSLPFPCSAVLAEHLSIPLVFILSTLAQPFVFHKLPSSFSYLSYLPAYTSNNPSTGLHFHQRIVNLLLRWLWDLTLPYTWYNGYDSLMKELDICPDKTIMDLMNAVSLILIKADFVFEEAQPLPPDVKLVGPTLTKPAKPLPKELEEFMQSSGDNGVVYVSFGADSFETSIVPDKVQPLANIFAQLPYKVLWKTRDVEGLIIGNNTRIFSWVPQNDILGHPKTKLFVTHCGLNSLYEGIYHSVPMVACPLYRDQLDNSHRLASRGLAIHVDLTSSQEILEEKLIAAVTEVREDARYKERLEHSSRVLRSRRRTPVQEAVDWIEHVLQVEDMSHLKPHGDKMSFYQLYFLDVMGFFVVILVVVFYIVKRLIRFVVNLAQKKREKEQKSKSE